MSTVPVTGTVKPFVPGQRVEITFFLNGSRLVTQKAKVHGGTFRARIRIEEAGKYAASARLPAGKGLRGDETVRKSWRVAFPALHQGQCGEVVIGFEHDDTLERVGDDEVRGELRVGARSFVPHPCMRRAKGRDHDAGIRIGSKLRGGGPIL